MSDGVGRKRRTEQEWREILRQQAASGLSIPAFCGQHGLVESTFHWWRGERARRDSQRTPMALLPVQVRPDELAGVLEIVLAGDRRIRLTGPLDRQLLTDVLTVLEGSGC